MDTYADIIKAINVAVAQETLDDRGLLMISNHVHDLRQDLRRQKGREIASEICSGTKVRIRQDAPLRPHYILGTEATVVSVNRTTATIKLGDVPTPPAGGRSRFFTGQMIRCPLDAIELV
jgi:hypothetical protein